MAEKRTKQARLPLKQLERIQADPYHADQSIQWIADTALTRYADYVENGEGRRDAIVASLNQSLENQRKILENQAVIRDRLAKLEQNDAVMASILREMHEAILTLAENNSAA